MPPHLQKTGVTLEELYHQAPSDVISADYAAWIAAYGDGVTSSSVSSSSSSKGAMDAAAVAGGESGPERRAENSYINYCIRTGEA